MAFCYQAIDPSGRSVRDLIQATSVDEAARLLQAKGLLVTRLTETAEGQAATETQAAAASHATKKTGRVRSRDVVYFTQQMAMLLGSGARMVPALQAVEHQAQSDAMKRLIRQLRARVEDGVPMSVALADHTKVFDGVFRSLTAAGESTGQMPGAFTQLADYTRKQQEIRQRLIGALTYPAVLVLMCFGVMGGLFGFVLPRFRSLFSTLGADLPASTRIMMDLSDVIGNHWLVVLVAIAGTAAGLVLAFRSPAGQRWWAGAFTRVPVAGAIVRRVILAKFFRVWGVLVANNVGVIDALHLARGTTRSRAFHGLIDHLAEAVTDGRLIGSALRESPLVPPTMAAAVATGEESGRLGESLLFIAGTLESENSQLLASLSRIIEPVILVVMGVVVGLVAVSLFMPLFDVATLAGGA
ncbi:MAG TPA: type II secretion system F family protein [Phycisphaerae bacterium]|nr:type II secretion system F family protein [Phycisphaerae bacterium]HRY66893.1 type II secretion system F family protein [Phycisphaerae bacterium]HSA26952.1 type II secretion system F family protein [Phycisphaerae bacterium]